MLVGGPKNVNRDRVLVGMRERLLPQALQNDRLCLIYWRNLELDPDPNSNWNEFDSLKEIKNTELKSASNSAFFDTFYDFVLVTFS